MWSAMYLASCQTPQRSRAAPGLPGEAEEVHPRFGRNTALVDRLTCIIEGVDLQPAVVRREADCPDDRCDAGGREIEFEDRVGHAVGIRPEDARPRLLGKVEPVASDVGVSLIEHGR